MSSAGATLQGSFSGATGEIHEAGIVWSANASLLNDPVSNSNSESLHWGYDDGCLGTNASGNISVEVSSLEASTQYYYRAFVAEYNGQSASYEYRFGDIEDFTTSAAAVATPAGWLELPSYTTSSISGTTSSTLADLYYLKHSATMGGQTQRNYTCLYDPEMYASYWVAYPLCYDHINGSGREDQWAYDPLVPEAKQTNLKKGAYGVNVATANYSNNLYSRGHQIANSDRNGVDDMADQTFYMTNLTPQLQYGFNGGIWNNLEVAIQGLTSSCDTVYVVTGAAYRKKGGNETINTIVNSRDSKTIPVPNYYWKALLKVTWNGDSVTAASTIGFWYPHTDLKDESYYDAKYVVNVNQIETWTGLNLFSNLPEALQNTAETNTNWTTFRNF